jgi:hypothetical protein
VPPVSSTAASADVQRVLADIANANVTSAAAVTPTNDVTVAELERELQQQAAIEVRLCACNSCTMSMCVRACVC